MVALKIDPMETVVSPVELEHLIYENRKQIQKRQLVSQPQSLDRWINSCVGNNPKMYVSM